MILDWGKPPKKMTHAEWSRISADGAPPGVYVPNMSDEDAAKWRAKFISGRDPRVEIRTLKGSQMLIVVRANGTIRLSMNGPAELGVLDWVNMQGAVQEALDRLEDASR